MSLIRVALDGQNDYNDLIPLDYDMDGDKKINYWGLVNPESVWYTERLVAPVNNDPNLQKNEEGYFFSDDDIDGDGLDLVNGIVKDFDRDADGMSDYYESNYGMNPYGVSGGGGWQNMFIYNARYAVIIVGGGKDQSGTMYPKEGNHAAFWNDGSSLYNKLVTDYNYIGENVYLLHSYWRDTDHTGDSRVDGDATLNNIRNTFNVLKNKVTINDFFFFAEICHSSGPWSFNNALHENCWFGPSTSSPFQYNLSEGLDSLMSARMCIVLQSCYSEGGIDDLSDDGRIVIAATKSGEFTYTWKTSYFGGPSPEQAAEHWEFLHNDKGDWFLNGLANADSPHPLKYAFDKGYDAARDDDWGAEDDTSHALLDDNGDGVGHEKGALSETDPTADGYIAKCTYL